MKIFGQLEQACVEQLSSDPGANTQGRLWWNSTDGQLKLDDGVNKRALLRNDDKIIIGNDGTLANNVRLHRGSGQLLQLVLANDTIADGTTSNDLARMSVKTDVFTEGTKPAASGNLGRVIYVSDSVALSVGTGSAWNNILDQGLATTKGDILARSATAIARLPVGSNNQVLTADSSQTLGVKWATIGTASTSAHSAAYTAAIGDGLSINDMSGGLPYTITLPSAVGNNGERLKFKYTSSSFTTASPALTIGAVTAMHSDGEMLTIISNGTTWIVEDRFVPSQWLTLNNFEWATSGWTSISNRQATWKRVGDTIWVRGYFTVTTPLASQALVSLASIPGINMTAAQVAKIIVGNWAVSSAAGTSKYSSADRHGPMRFDPGLAAIDFVYQNNAGNAMGSANANVLTGNNDGVHFEFQVPITGWNG